MYQISTSRGKNGTKIMHEIPPRTHKHANPINKLVHMLFIHFKLWKYHKTIENISRNMC